LSDLGKNFVLFYLSVLKIYYLKKQRGLVHRTARAGTQDREGWYTGQRGGWCTGQRRGWYTGQQGLVHRTED